MTQFCVLRRSLCQVQLAHQVIPDNGVGCLQQENTHRETRGLQGLHATACVLVFWNRVCTCLKGRLVIRKANTAWHGLPAWGSECQQ